MSPGVRLIPGLAGGSGRVRRAGGPATAPPGTDRGMAMPRPPLDARFAAAQALGDGRRPLLFMAMGLIVGGAVALALAASGRFLPHDERFLGMTARELCAVHGCRVVHFMIHDRAAFGGVGLALGLVYLWLIYHPLREGQRWAWWTLLASGGAGFLSFPAYAGFGYLDTWHGAATLGLLACFVAGMIPAAPGRAASRTMADAPRPPLEAGRVVLLVACIGVTGAGLVILTIGTTAVFVPEDLAYLGVDAVELRRLNPRLVPLIAHDRAGFGGAMASAGLALVPICRFARPTRALWRALAGAGAVGFGPAIGVHFAIGYTNLIHLAPATLGAATYALGLSWMRDEFEPGPATSHPS